MAIWLSGTGLLTHLNKNASRADDALRRQCVKRLSSIVLGAVFFAKQEGAPGWMGSGPAA